ncbi:MAG TPA: DUF2442 domain-containing protein [Rhodoblastus sp.]|nr:DUF2442 domain-containing protein [Rhodoblastus sp.]
MSISASSLRFDDDLMWVELSDGRTLGVPLAWFPRLLHATPAQRLRFEISKKGLHWEELDEDISVDGLLAGRGDLSLGKTRAA